MNLLLPPPPRAFLTHTEIIEYVEDHAFAHGYALRLKRSRKDRHGDVKNFNVRCDRSGTYATSQIRRKNCGSRLTNCPFELFLGKKDGWWHLEVRNPEHNHDGDEELSGHPRARRMNDEERARIREMSSAGIRPREIVTTIRQNDPNSRVISRTIYNERQRLRKEKLNGRTPIQTLIDELSVDNYMFDFQSDDEGHITHLFFAHQESIELTRTYSFVLLMDCTYKTNRFGMPLLSVVGVTSLNTTFFSCFVFMKEESEADYDWGLRQVAKLFEGMDMPQVIATDRELALIRAIESNFPQTRHLLCLWHIEKNVLAKCKGYFNSNGEFETFLKMWTAVVRSRNVEEFEKALQNIKDSIGDQHQALCYIQDTWLPYRERFVHAWTDRYLHFGATVTSRVEGAHAVIKRYLHVSTGDLRAVKIAISLAIENQVKELRAAISSEKIRVPHKIRIPFFDQVITQVSTFALNKIFQQYQLASAATDKTPLKECTQSFTSTFGLPCAHTILRRRQTGGKLLLGDIHQQWWIIDRDIPERLEQSEQNNEIDRPSQTATRSLSPTSKLLYANN